MEARYPKENPVRANIFDTHAHVSSPAFDEDRDGVIERAKLSGVTFLEVGFDEDSSQASLSLAEKIGIYCAAGIHPHEALRSQALEERWKFIEGLASQSTRVRAIGEIGLDYFRDISPRKAQAEAFAMGLDLARRLELPVIIHQRDAHEDLLSMVRANAGTPLIFHCFSQGLDYARECLDLGGYIGLGGTLTYPRNGYLRDMLAFLPLDRVLVETDCPYLPPQARRGKRNEPSFILEVISAIAEVLGSTAGEIARLTLENGRRVFGIMEQKW